MLGDKLKNSPSVSEYASENLMYSLLQEVITECGYPELKVLCHVSLRNIIGDVSRMDEDEKKYALHPCTHIDFSVINRVTKKLILAVEVDGYKYHNKETRQAERDLLKNQIFEKYSIPYLRFSTTGSNEKEILASKLKSLMSVVPQLKAEDRPRTEKYRYCCFECKKQFKVTGAGKKAKCPQCNRILHDLKISDAEYEALDKRGKAEIIKRLADGNE